MSDEQEWAKIRKHKPSAFEAVGGSALRVTLLFGGLAVALGLFATPLFDRDSDNRVLANFGARVDPITTAGTRRTPTGSYVVRRSVLQKNPTSKCIIRPSGLATGDC